MTAVDWRKSSHSYANGSCAEVATWRKSSWSTFNGNCIEVADWRKSGRCQTGECIEVADWRKSGRSSHNGQCIEAGTGGAVVGVRDSTDRGGPALTFAPDAWQAFTAALKALPAPRTAVNAPAQP